MLNRSLRAAGAALAFAGLAACSSTAPVERVHSLLPPVPALAAAPGASALPARVIVFDAPLLPPGLDQPQWLLRQPDGSLRLLEQERWAAPLREELRAALLVTLAAQAGAVPQEASAAAAQARLRLNVQRFELQAGEPPQVLLQAQWSVAALPPGGEERVCQALLQAQAEAGADPARALAQAQAAQVRALGERMARSLLGPGC